MSDDTQRSPEFTVTVGEGVRDEIESWAAALADLIHKRAYASSYEQLADQQKVALDAAENLINVLTRRLLHSNPHDGDLRLYMDRFSGEHAIGYSYNSGFTGAVIQELDEQRATKTAWRSVS